MKVRNLSWNSAALVVYNAMIVVYFAAVYTRNRNFRLFLSSKLGKDVRLRVAKENKFKVHTHC